MSDGRLRELERRWRETGALDDEIAWLKLMRRLGRGSGFRPTVTADPANNVALFVIAYVSPCDSKRCPASRAVVLLHRALKRHRPGALTSLAVEGDRTLFFEVDLPQFDLGPLKARVVVRCAAGAVYFRATRRLAVQDVAGVVFLPSLVEERLAGTFESARHLEEDLRGWGVEPEQLPFVLHGLPGDERKEVPLKSVAEGLHLSFVATYCTDRNSGKGIEASLFECMSRARAAYLGG